MAISSVGASSIYVSPYTYSVKPYAGKKNSSDEVSPSSRQNELDFLSEYADSWNPSSKTNAQDNSYSSDRANPLRNSGDRYEVGRRGERSQQPSNGAGNITSGQQNTSSDPSKTQTNETTNDKKSEDTTGKSGGKAKSPKASESIEQQRQNTDVQRMRMIEQSVRTHEQAHKAVGGQYTGGISYSYAVGPDGKRYIVGGEVPISAPSGNTPEETIRIMDQVKRAALAPADPSGADRAIAASASSKQMSARQELSEKTAERLSGGDEASKMKSDDNTKAQSLNASADADLAKAEKADKKETPSWNKKDSFPAIIKKITDSMPLGGKLDFMA